MPPNTPNEIEAVVEEACAIIGKFNQGGDIDVELTVGIANLIRTTLTQLNASRTAEIRELYWKHLESCITGKSEDGKVLYIRVDKEHFEEALSTIN
jgi:hypothetical protein